MRRLFLLGVLGMTGCANLVGPFQHRTPQRVDDPCLSIAEQQQRANDRLALPVESRDISPPISVPAVTSAPPTTVYVPGPLAR
jgi:hypothetical protein